MRVKTETIFCVHCGVQNSQKPVFGLKRHKRIEK